MRRLEQESLSEFGVRIAGQQLTRRLTAMDDTTSTICDEDRSLPKRFRKFGDICLTEINERVFVCSVCQCICNSPTLFWEHQKNEHHLVAYGDVERTMSSSLPTPHCDRDRNRDRDRDRDDDDDDDAYTENSGGGDKHTETSTNGFAMTPINHKDDQQHDNGYTDTPILHRALRYPRKTDAAELDYPPTSVNQPPYEDQPLNEDDFDEFITFFCPECGRRFETNDQWKDHITAEHNFFAEDQLNITLYKTRPNGSAVYKCNVCQVQLNKPNSGPLRRHKLTHMPFKSFCCRLCGTKIRHKSGIVHHIRSVHRKGHKKSFSCQNCNKSFYSALQYKRHMHMHEDNSKELTLTDGDTNADLSDGSYDASAFLITEITEECDKQTCGEQSEDATNYGYEGLWQEDIATALEREIQNASRRISLLKQRSLAMTTTLECEVCYKYFVSKKELDSHVHKHGKKMDCRLCGAKITTLASLRRHKSRCKTLMKDRATREQQSPSPSPPQQQQQQHDAVEESDKEKSIITIPKEAEDKKNG